MIGEMGVLLPSLEVGDEGWEEDLVDGMRWADWFWGWIAITGVSCVVFVSAGITILWQSIYDSIGWPAGLLIVDRCSHDSRRY